MENRQMDSKSARTRSRQNQITSTFVQVCVDNVQKKTTIFAYYDEEKTRHWFKNWDEEKASSQHESTIFEIPFIGWRYLSLQWCPPHTWIHFVVKNSFHSIEMSAEDEKTFLLICSVNKHEITKFNFMYMQKVLNIWCVVSILVFMLISS